MKKFLKINYVPGPNIGDNVFPYMLHKLNIPFSWVSHEEEEKIISAGSIIGVASRKNTIVWGSGIIRKNTEVDAGIIPMLVRGTHTAQNCTNTKIPLGDPALALPKFYKPNNKPKTHKIGIIPHLIDLDTVKKFLYDTNACKESFKLIAPNAYYFKDNFENVIDDIVSCEKIISTSLHGLIMANAYGIPCAWWRFGNSLLGDDIKFADYSSAFNHTMKKHETFQSIKDYWCPSSQELCRVTNDILNNSPIYNELDTEYYTHTKSEKI